MIKKCLFILKLLYLLFYFQLSNISFSSAEGTREIMPVAGSYGRLELYEQFSSFALYGCLSEDRLYIHIKSPGEKICFGFGNSFDHSQILMNDVSCRIVDPSGNIAFSQILLPSSGNGHISNWNQAVAGPDIITPTGYPCLNLTALMAGDYYIEFTYTDLSVRREFEFFDITVINNSNNPVNGRVWSKAWQFTTTGSPSPDYWDYPFTGKLFVYADDGIVTSVDFNGMRPYVFVFSANQTGCFNSGNLIQDRKSVYGRFTYPQYKIFLNDPDSTCFPTGLLGDFIEETTITGCPPENYCININVNKTGTVEIVINIDGIPGYQSNGRDILMIEHIDSGNNCIFWNGRDNLNDPVAFGANINVEINYYNGITHIPIFDVEYNEYGFKVAIVRPAAINPTPALFWDDSGIPGFISAPTDGCLDLNGCHDFTNLFGDSNTVNTWWYAASNIKDSFIFEINYLKIDISKTDEYCFDAQGSIHLDIQGGELPYSYLWNSGQDYPIITGLQSGQYTVTVSDMEGCSLLSSVIIENIQCPINIPNIITPNGDGFNETFTIPNIEFYKNQLLIFNRWGRLIRQYIDYINQWDGTTETNEPVADGVYFFVLRLVSGKEFHGTITVLR